MARSCVLRTGALLLIPMLALSAPETRSAVAQAPDGAHPALVLAAGSRDQVRTVFVPAPTGACAPFPARGTCRLIVSAELRGRGVEPMRTGSRFLTGPHVRTGYATISVCRSPGSPTRTERCDPGIPSCASVAASRCAPLWYARVSTEYQYNGARVHRIWLDPSILGAVGFIVRTAHSFSLPKASEHGPLAIGEDITVTGTVPATRGTRVVLRLRMMVSPSGGVTYTVRGQ